MRSILVPPTFSRKIYTAGTNFTRPLVVTVATNINSAGQPGEKPVPDEQKLPVMATILATMFLPGFILGIASCWHNKNNNSNMLKTFVAHPSVVLMPTFTHFAFTSNKKLCRGRREKREQEKEKGDSVDPYITFSPRLTIMNVILSIVCNVAYCIIMTHISTYFSAFTFTTYHTQISTLSSRL